MDHDTSPDNPYFRFGVDNICGICHKLLTKTASTYPVDTLITIVGDESIKAYKVLESISKFVLCANGPQFLCSMCYNTTKNTYQFQQACNKAQTLLDNYLKHQQLSSEVGHIKEEINVGETVLDIELIEIKEERCFDADEAHEPDAVQQEDEERATKQTDPISTLNKHEEVHVSTDDDEDNLTLKEMLDRNGKEREETHADTYGNKTGFVCKHCGKNYISESYLINHEQTHHEEQLYKCVICEEAFTDRSNLMTHMRVHTNEYPHQCKICSKTFHDNSSLWRHVRFHIDERPHKCKFCSKTFAKKAILNQHARLHTGELPYQCKLCEMSFTHKSRLTAHERTHTGERPYPCKFCTKTFNDRSNLRKHMRIHTDDRPYYCKVCKKTFSEKANLTKHERTHTGERPYQCKLCEMSFSHKVSLTLHEQYHTGELPFECKICKKQFSLVSNLNRHLKAMHSEG